MISCLVVDDEKHALSLIEGYIAKVPLLKLAYSTTKPVEAFQFVQKNQVDLIFLDINMPDLDGLQFLKLVNGKSMVILTTAYPEHALQGYEHDIIDYLLKPILFERFLKSVQKAMRLLPSEANISPKASDEEPTIRALFIKSHSRKVVKVDVWQITHVEALGNYVAVYTEKDKILSLTSIKELEEQLPKGHFIRVHKSYLINIEKINTVDGNVIYIKDISVPVGEKYKNAFQSVIQKRTLNNG